MFCTNCGEEIEAGWVKCPYCGTVVQGESAPVDNATDTEDNKFDGNENSQKEPQNSDASQQSVNYFQSVDGAVNNARRKIQHRSFLKFLLLSLITFGIFGIYVLYGFVEDVNEICEGDGKKSPNFIIVLLLSVVTLGIYSIYWWYRQGDRIQEAAPRYGVEIRESGTTILVWIILGCTLMPGIGSFVATYIMFDNVNRIALSYNQEVSKEEFENMGKPHPHLIRNVIIVYAVMVVVLLIPIISFLIGFISDTSELEEVSNKSVESQISEDLSDVDLGEYIGNPGMGWNKLDLPMMKRIIPMKHWMAACILCAMKQAI